MGLLRIPIFSHEVPYCGNLVIEFQITLFISLADPDKKTNENFYFNQGKFCYKWPKAAAQGPICLKTY